MASGSYDDIVHDYDHYGTSYTEEAKFSEDVGAFEQAPSTQVSY